MPQSVLIVVLHGVSNEWFSHGLNTDFHGYGRRLFRF